MSDYTPATKQVRAAWNALTKTENERYRERGVGPVTEEESNAEFDHWLNQVKADAWDEGAHAAWERSTPEVNGAHYRWRHEGEPRNPYREEL